MPRANTKRYRVLHPLPRFATLEGDKSFPSTVTSIAKALHVDSTNVTKERQLGSIPGRARTLSGGWGPHGDVSR